MAQAAQILTLPVEKLTFAAEAIDVPKVMAKYKRHTLMVAIALKFLTQSPREMKQHVAKMEGSADLGDDVVETMIVDFEEAAGDFQALSELIRASAARMTAVHRRLI